MLAKISYREIQNSYDSFKEDTRFENFLYVINYINQIDSNRFDIDKSYIEIDNYQEPSLFCGIYFFPSNSNSDNFKLYVWLDISYNSVFVGLENYGENTYAERLEYEERNVYEKCFNEIVYLKFERELWGINNVVSRVVYKGFRENENFSLQNRFGFILKRKWFWEKEILLQQQFFNNISG